MPVVRSLPVLVLALSLAACGTAPQTQARAGGTMVPAGPPEPVVLEAGGAVTPETAPEEGDAPEAAAPVAGVTGGPE